MPRDCRWLRSEVASWGHTAVAPSFSPAPSLWPRAVSVLVERAAAGGGRRLARLGPADREPSPGIALALPAASLVLGRPDQVQSKLHRLTWFPQLEIRGDCSEAWLCHGTVATAGRTTGAGAAWVCTRAQRAGQLPLLVLGEYLTQLAPARRPRRDLPDLGQPRPDPPASRPTSDAAVARRRRAPFDIAALSVGRAYDYPATVAIARRLRAADPSLVIVAGGYHVSAVPGDFLDPGALSTGSSKAGRGCPGCVGYAVVIARSVDSRAGRGRVAPSPRVAA